MRGYLGRKVLVYALTFFVAVTLAWVIPRFMPGDPVRQMISQQGSLSDPDAFAAMQAYYDRVFGLDEPLWRQYVNFWVELFRGNLGVSVWSFPRPVGDLIMGALPYTLALLLPAIGASWWVGNKFGAFAARRPRLDNTVLPLGYIITATPYVWLAILLAWAIGHVLGWVDPYGPYDFGLRATWSWQFVSSLLEHWFLPFLSLFLVALGGWAIGMRSMIIYELETDYASYLSALGAPQRLIRRYAFRNAMLPQITGLAVQLGVILAGNIATEVVFAYPGLGSLILNAINARDFFLLNGVLLFVVIGVLIANFLIDIAYMIVDPRTRTGMQGVTT